MTFDRGQRVRVQAPGVPEFATVRFAIPGDSDGSWDLILVDDEDRRHEINLAAGDTETVRKLVSDGHGDSARVLAAMWTQWMDAAATNAESSAMASMPLKPYAHQTTAVYGAMLPQPQLRFLLADAVMRNFCVSRDTICARKRARGAVIHREGVTRSRPGSALGRPAVPSNAPPIQ